VSIIITYTSSFCNPPRLISLTISHLRDFLIFGKNNSRAKKHTSISFTMTYDFTKSAIEHFLRQNPQNKASEALSIRLRLLNAENPDDELKPPISTILGPSRRTDDVDIRYAGASMRAVCLIKCGCARPRGLDRNPKASTTAGRNQRTSQNSLSLPSSIRAISSMEPSSR